MGRVHNFSAGPATLPFEVLSQVKEEMLDWNGSGMSVMEMSHRGKEFSSIIETAKSDLKQLVSLPDNYEILFMQGGATAQFSMVPMNLLKEDDKADYICTGQWGKKAIKEAEKFGAINLAASSEDRQFSYIPAIADWKLRGDSGYIHITSNETIGGVEFNEIPETGKVPLVADMSSSFLSRPIDVSKYGLIYAGAQKNVGPAGLTIVLIRRDLIGLSKRVLPGMYDYKVCFEAGSMSNTPPCFPIYVAGLVFKWLQALGGLEAMEQVNKAKSKMLYEYIDGSGFYRNPISKQHRSRMNIPFSTPTPDTDRRFLSEAVSNNLCELKGHRSVGGMRASIYNSMSLDAVKCLVEFMKGFVGKYG